MTTYFGESVLRLHGPDALRFLQGQTTANFTATEPGQILRGAFSDPKGRVIGDFLAALLSSEEVLLRTRTAVADHLQQHLTRYLVFSKATLEASDWRVSATTDDSAGTAFVQRDGLLLLPRGDGLTEVWCLPDTACRDTLDENDYHLREIALMEARIEVDTIGDYLPQDLNYDLNGAVNFNKGCYTGQEVIARLHFRGSPKRRLYQAQCESVAPPAPGVPVTDGDSGKTLGSVVNAAASGREIHLLIEAVDTVFKQSPTVRINGEPISIRAKD